MQNVSRKFTYYKENCHSSNFIQTVKNCSVSLKSKSAGGYGIFWEEQKIGPFEEFLERAKTFLIPLNCPERKIMWAQAGGSDHFPKPFSSVHFLEAF